MASRVENMWADITSDEIIDNLRQSIYGCDFGPGPDETVRYGMYGETIKDLPKKWTPPRLFFEIPLRTRLCIQTNQFIHDLQVKCTENGLALDYSTNYMEKKAVLEVKKI